MSELPSTMKQRFIGSEGRGLLVSALQTQKAFIGIPEAIQEIIEQGELLDVAEGEILLKEGSVDNWIFFILTGTFSILVKGKQIAIRSINDHLGEVAALDPSQKRSATVIALEDSVVCRLSEPVLRGIAERHPSIWRNIGIELARRLSQRNNLVDAVNEQVRVFVICSAEALPIAHEIQSIMSHERDVIFTVWTDGVFKASHYPIESLEAALDESDFAVAIAQPDDSAESRGITNQIPRDNVIFELGFFMGRLGRKRAILFEPNSESVKLPSDLSGLTTIGYKTGAPKDLPALLAPACHELRKIIKELGPKE